MMNFSDLTMAELEKTKDALNAEIYKRKEIEKRGAKTELECLLERINKLQDEYGFKISCEDYSGDWMSDALNFELEE